MGVAKKAKHRRREAAAAKAGVTLPQRRRKNADYGSESDEEGKQKKAPKMKAKKRKLQPGEQPEQRDSQDYLTPRQVRQHLLGAAGRRSRRGITCGIMHDYFVHCC